MSKAYALFGWSMPAIESAKRIGKPFVVVSLPAFEPYAKENNIPFVSWDFETWNETMNSFELIERMKPFNVGLVIPLFEETVEWAGAVNSIYQDDPRVLNRAFLFRNKAIMKRRALISGLRVGAFEEAYTIDDVHRFQKRLNDANLQLAGEADSWIHLKPFQAMGTVGHKLLRSKEDIDKKLDHKDFPCLIESHLPGQEFSCEVFVHNGKIQFLNVTEYVKLGHSNFIPASKNLMDKCDLILKENQKLVDAFGFKYGMLHPEWFLTPENSMNFGEVAARIPGGHIYELMQKAYDIDPYEALFLCSNPDTPTEEIDALFNKARENRGKVYAGCVMVYPKPGEITRLNIPEELKEDEYFEEHTLHPPSSNVKIPAERVGFGNHFGSVFFKGNDPERMRELLMHYENVNFYA